MSSLLVSDIVKMADRQLTEAGIEEHENEAKILYCWLKHIDYSRFFMEWGEPADDRTTELYFDLVARRCQRIPLQHLTGEQDFMGMTFTVTPEVLIPRMDTEAVVARAEELFDAKRGAAVLDLCCGSGVIGISLAHRHPGIKVTAVDSSPQARQLTERNAGDWGVKMEVRQGDLFEPVRRKRYHMIICNPPYIPSAAIETLMPEVKDHEPREALDGGEDGLDFYRRICAEAPQHLKKSGLLVLEIGSEQSRAVEGLLLETEQFCDIQTTQDLAGRDRVVSARLVGKGR
ncbi:MAG: peptide chain release factor N(5)-glutamine methyltransferase [Anaerovoracaceae bacterium]|jgi:release factor glutamine methyltransferase